MFKTHLWPASNVFVALAALRPRICGMPVHFSEQDGLEALECMREGYYTLADSFAHTKGPIISLVHRFPIHTRIARDAKNLCARTRAYSTLDAIALSSMTLCIS